MSATKTWAQHKEEGNDAYKQGKIEAAVEAYIAALRSPDVPNADRAVILCNRAQCYLKLNNNAAAIDDCTASLTHSPDNVKALFRRWVAWEGEGSFSQRPAQGARDIRGTFSPSSSPLCMLLCC